MPFLFHDKYIVTKKERKREKQEEILNINILIIVLKYMLYLNYWEINNVIFSDIRDNNKNFIPHVTSLNRIIQKKIRKEIRYSFSKLL